MPKTNTTNPENGKVYFEPEELSCKCGCNSNEFDGDFLETLCVIRESCYGKAVDILCSGESALEVVRVALANGINRIGVNQKGSGRFIHLDGCTVEEGFSSAIWSY